MRKVLYLLVMMFVGYGVSAQETKPYMPSNLTEDVVKHVTTEQAQEMIREYGDVYWEEDFGAGATSLNTWTMTDGTGNGWNFIWSDSPIPGPNGEWVGGTDPFASTTVANGYLCLPADEYNHPISPNYIDMDATAQLPVMNFSGKPSVMIVFEQYYRYCCGGAQRVEVQVSNDGVNWNNYDVSFDLATNASSDNPDVVFLNISSTAGNQSTVYIQFYYGDVSHYYWAIDDIKIIEGPKHDLRIDESYVMSVTDFGAAGTGFNGYYSVLPMSQLMPTFFQVDVFNNGSEGQTNVMLEGPVMDEMGNTVFTTMGDTALIPVDSTYSLVGDWFMATDTGHYEVTLTVTADSADQNDVDNMTESVDWWVAPEADGVATMERHYYYSTDLGPADFNGGADGDFIGSDFTISDSTEVQSMDIYIGANTTPGTILIGQMYMRDGSNNVLQIQSEEYVIQESDTASWVTLNFITVDPEDDDVFPDVTYIVGAEFYWGGGSDVLEIGVDRHGPHQYWLVSNLRIGTDWYWISYCPLIKLNLDQRWQPDNVAEEVAFEEAVVYPNPATELVNIENAAGATISVMNILGEVITVVENADAVQTISTANLEAGTYVVSIQDGKHVRNEKITVVR